MSSTQGHSVAPETMKPGSLGSSAGHGFRTIRVFALALGFALAATVVSAGGDGEGDSDQTMLVVASIKPVHSLVSAVMAGVGAPHLIIRGAQSPHTFSMRPSDAAALAKAGVIFLIDEHKEVALAGPIANLGDAALVVQLAGAEGLVLKPLREGGAFEAHDHGEQDAAERDGKRSTMTRTRPVITRATTTTRMRRTTTTRTTTTRMRRTTTTRTTTMMMRTSTARMTISTRATPTTTGISTNMGTSTFTSGSIPRMPC